MNLGFTIYDFRFAILDREAHQVVYRRFPNRLSVRPRTIGRFGNLRHSRLRSLRYGVGPVQRGFTLVELLVVIAIIGILSAALLVVISKAVVSARMTQTRLDVTRISDAIEEYDSFYGHMPVPTGVQQSGSNNVTYGGTYASAVGVGNQFPVPSAPGWGPSAFGYFSPVGIYVISNSDVMAILLDQTNYPNTTIRTVNAGHQKNPMQKDMLSVKFTGDTSSPGVGTDLNFRDPWGNPYIISMDLNGDNKCEDAFYAPYWMSSSSGAAAGPGVNGLSFQAADGNYLFHGNVMVWSMGPDGPYNHAPSSFTYPAGPTSVPGGGAWAQNSSNKNHILSWAL